MICLDVLRAISRDPESLRVLMYELGVTFGSDSRYDGYVPSDLTLTHAED